MNNFNVYLQYFNQTGYKVLSEYNEFRKSSYHSVYKFERWFDKTYNEIDNQILMFLLFALFLYSLCLIVVNNCMSVNTYDIIDDLEKNLKKSKKLLEKEVLNWSEQLDLQLEMTAQLEDQIQDKNKELEKFKEKDIFTNTILDKFDKLDQHNRKKLEKIAKIIEEENKNREFDIKSVRRAAENEGIKWKSFETLSHYMNMKEQLNTIYIVLRNFDDNKEGKYEDPESSSSYDSDEDGTEPMSEGERDDEPWYDYDADEKCIDDILKDPSQSCFVKCSKENRKLEDLLADNDVYFRYGKLEGDEGYFIS